MLLLLGIGMGALIILAFALRPKSRVKKYAVGFIASLLVCLIISLTLLMEHQFGTCLIAFFGGLLVAGWFWSQMFSSPTDCL